MPNHHVGTESSVATDIARLQEQVRALEKTVEVLENTLRAESNLKNLQTKDELKGIKVILSQTVKKLNSLELKITRYAGGAGVLTALAIKILDKFIH